MNIRKSFVVTGILMCLFLLFTAAVMKVDVQPIGPEDSSVGLSTFNQMIHRRIGVHLIWYVITDWLGVAAILVALGFSVVGFIQLIRRKSLFKVDSDILLLGLFYIIVAASYIFFEIIIVNYRPIIMNGGLEASFPSSHAMIILCIMTTAMIQFQNRFRNKIVRITSHILSILIISVTIIGRLISGVHWFTDILAGILLASALIMLYYSVFKVIKQKEIV